MHYTTIQYTIMEGDRWQRWVIEISPLWCHRVADPSPRWPMSTPPHIFVSLRLHLCPLPNLWKCHFLVGGCKHRATALFSGEGWRRRPCVSKCIFWMNLLSCTGLHLRGSVPSVVELKRLQQKWKLLFFVPLAQIGCKMERAGDTAVFSHL